MAAQKRTLSFLVASLALMSFFVQTNALVPSQTLIDWSFVACQTDATCAAALPSGNDTEVFEEMLITYFEMRPDGGVTILPIVEPCVQSILPTDPCANCTVTCTQVQSLWLALMRDARVCHINEEWVAGRCRCIEGKNCREDCIAFLSTDLDSILFICIVSLVAAIVMAGWIHWGQRRIQLNIELDERETFQQVQEIAELKADLRSLTALAEKLLSERSAAAAAAVQEEDV